MKTNKIKWKGEINLVGVKVPCYVHGDGRTRVLSAQGIREVLKKIGVGDIERKSGEKLKQLLNQRTSQIFVYDEKKGGKTNPIVIGYDAMILEDLFNVCLEATKSNAKLSPKQKTIAKQCEMLTRTFAKVGIIALVDEASGYQHEKEKLELHELQKVLKTYTLSVRAFKMISENKEEFFKHLKENYSSADSGTTEVSKEEFDEALKVLLNSPSKKRK